MKCQHIIKRAFSAAFIAIALSLVPFIAYCDRMGSWSTLQVSHQEERLTVGASEESRIGVNRHESPKKVDELHSTLFADWRVSQMLSVGVQDDLVYIRNGCDARYRRDNRPGLNVALSYNTAQWDFMNRSRFVMRDLEGAQPYFRYRNLSKVVAPVLGSFCREHCIRPFIAYEWYFDEGSRDVKFRKGDKFSQFWTDAGVQVKLSSSCSISVFYRLVELKADEAWSPSHVIGAFLSFTF